MDRPRPRMRPPEKRGETRAIAQSLECYRQIDRLEDEREEEGEPDLSPLIEGLLLPSKVVLFHSVLSIIHYISEVHNSEPQIEGSLTGGGRGRYQQSPSFLLRLFSPILLLLFFFHPSSTGMVFFTPKLFSAHDLGTCRGRPKEDGRHRHGEGTKPRHGLTSPVSDKL